jgi:hypothetical protein
MYRWILNIYFNLYNINHFIVKCISMLYRLDNKFVLMLSRLEYVSMDFKYIF